MRAARGILLRAAVVFTLGGLLAGCPKAGRVEGGAFESPGAFRIGLPGEGWTIRRNVRWGSRRLVDFHRPHEDVDLRVSFSPISAADRKIPLDVYADSLVLNYGRGRGIKTDVEAIQRVDFGAHEGVVVHATRTAGQVTRKMAQAFVRAGNRMVTLTYIAAPESYEKYAPDFAMAIQKFAVLLPADPPEIAVPGPEDLPQKKE